MEEGGTSGSGEVGTGKWNGDGEKGETSGG
jgi:hypothetical protein